MQMQTTVTPNTKNTSNKVVFNQDVTPTNEQQPQQTRNNQTYNQPDSINQGSNRQASQPSSVNQNQSYSHQIAEQRDINQNNTQQSNVSQAYNRQSNVQSQQHPASCAVNTNNQNNVETFNTIASHTAADSVAAKNATNPNNNITSHPVTSDNQPNQNQISIQNNNYAATQQKEIKSIYDGNPIPVDSNGRVRSERHQNTDAETKTAWAYLNHNDNLKPYTYTKLQPSDKAALDQYIKDRNAYVKELNDGKSHLDDYKKVLNEFNKLNDYGNKYPESVVPGPPCWWHGYNGWQSKDNIKNVWIASVGFISDTPDKDGHYLDVEPSFMMRHNAITGQTSFQNVIGGIYIGMPDGSSHCSNYINKSGVITVVPPKGYKFNVKESYQLEPYLTLKYKGKPMLISLTPDKAVFDFQVYADAGYQTIGTMVTPIPGHPGYYKMDNNHYFQLVVTPNGQQSKILNLDPQNKNDYQDTIDWEEDTSPTLTGGFGTGDRKPGDLTRTVITMHTNGQDPKKMSNADRTFVVVAPAGWQFQNIRAAKTMGPDWAKFEYNDVHDNRDSDWKKGDKLVRAPIDDGTTKTLYATPDQAHIGFFDFNRKFMSFNGQPTLGGTSHGGYDRLWLLPDQTWKGLPGQKKNQAFVEPISKTGATINANNLTVDLGSKHDFGSVSATDWMGKPTTAKLIKGSVDMNKAGTYQLTYENVNDFGIKSDKTIQVTVKEPDLQHANGVLQQSQAKQVGTYPWFYNINGKKVRFSENGIQQLKDGSFMLSGNAPDAKDPQNGRDQDLVMAHLDKNFNLIDAMTIEHGGHGSSCGAIMNNDGSIDVYELLNDRSNPKGNNRIVEVKYQPGKTLSNNDASIKVIQSLDNHVNYDGGDAISPDGKYLAYTTATDIYGTQNLQIHVCKLDNGKLTPIATIDKNKIEPGPQSIFQAFSFRNDDELMCTFGGAGNDPHDSNKMKADPREIVGVDIKTGKVISDDQLDFANNKVYGITGASTAEPEGITVTNDGKGVFVCIGTWQKGINYDDKTPQTRAGKIYFIPFVEKNTTTDNKQNKPDSQSHPNSRPSNNQNEHVSDNHNQSNVVHNNANDSSPQAGSNNNVKHIITTASRNDNDKTTVIAQNKQSGSKHLPLNQNVTNDKEVKHLTISESKQTDQGNNHSDTHSQEVINYYNGSYNSGQISYSSLEDKADNLPNNIDNHNNDLSNTDKSEINKTSGNLINDVQYHALTTNTNPSNDIRVGKENTYSSDANVPMNQGIEQIQNLNRENYFNQSKKDYTQANISSKVDASTKRLNIREIEENSDNEITALKGKSSYVPSKNKIYVNNEVLPETGCVSSEIDIVAMVLGIVGIKLSRKED